MVPVTYFEPRPQLLDLLLERQLFLLCLSLKLCRMLLHLARQLFQLFQGAFECAYEGFWVEGVGVLFDTCLNDGVG